MTEHCGNSTVKCVCVCVCVCACVCVCVLNENTDYCPVVRSGAQTVIRLLIR